MRRLFVLVAAVMISVVAFAQKEETVQKQTSILFDKTVCDFGTINKGDDATCVFTFKNVSKQPVALSNVKTSCGCTVADWPKEPIAKKKKGEIKVKYDSNRIGSFHKTVKVFLTGSETPIQLEIKGTVLAPNANQGDLKNNSQAAPQKASVEKKVASPAEKVPAEKTMPLEKKKAEVPPTRK